MLNYSRLYVSTIERQRLCQSQKTVTWRKIHSSDEQTHFLSPTRYIEIYYDLRCCELPNESLARFSNDISNNSKYKWLCRSIREEIGEKCIVVNWHVQRTSYHVQYVQHTRKKVARRIISLYWDRNGRSVLLRIATVFRDLIYGTLL